VGRTTDETELPGLVAAPAGNLAELGQRAGVPRPYAIHTAGVETRCGAAATRARGGGVDEIGLTA
jgi:hypothetical protein